MLPIDTTRREGEPQPHTLYIAVVIGTSSLPQGGIAMPRHLLFVLLAVSCLYSHLSTAHAASYTFTTLDVPFLGANSTVATRTNMAKTDSVG